MFAIIAMAILVGSALGIRFAHHYRQAMAKQQPRWESLFLDPATGIQLGAAYLAVGGIWQLLGLPSNPPEQVWLTLAIFALFVIQAVGLRNAVENGLIVRTVVWLARRKSGTSHLIIGGSPIVSLVFFLAPFVAFLAATALPK